MDNKNELIQYESCKTLPSVYSDMNLFNQAMEMAKSLAKADFIPNSYKNKPENCLIAIDTARQVGARSPLFVMQNLYVVNGKPSWSGQYTAAIVRKNFKNVRLEWYKNDGFEKLGCRVIAEDKNGNECQGSKITIEMAKKEGWYSKTGSKWLTMPEQMLQYRAFAFFARIHCPDKLMGLHDEFENEDIKPERSSQAEALEQQLSGDVIDAEYIKENPEPQ